MIDKVDFTSDDFKFISKIDEYYIEGDVVKCESDYSEWKLSSKISSGWGMFRGLTMVSYRGYTGVIPRMDGDTANFSEFDIYYKDLVVNDFTYYELISHINSYIRDLKIEEIIK